MSAAAEFRSEYACSFVQDDPLRRQLDQLAAHYHDETEAYDQIVCTWRNRRGVAMPASPEQASLSTRNAQETREWLGDYAVALGFTRNEWSRAINTYAQRYLGRCRD